MYKSTNTTTNGTQLTTQFFAPFLCLPNETPQFASSLARHRLQLADYAVFEKGNDILKNDNAILTLFLTFSTGHSKMITVRYKMTTEHSKMITVRYKMTTGK